MMCETCSDPEKHALEAEVERLKKQRYELVEEVLHQGAEVERLELELDAWPNQRRAYERELERLRERETSSRMKSRGRDIEIARFHRIEEAAREAADLLASVAASERGRKAEHAAPLSLEVLAENIAASLRAALGEKP